MDIKERDALVGKTIRDMVCRDSPGPAPESGFAGPKNHDITLIFMNGLSSQNKMLLETVCMGNENFFLNALSRARQISFNHRRIDSSPIRISKTTDSVFAAVAAAVADPTWERISFESLPDLPPDVWDIIFERAFQVPRMVKPATAYGEMGRLRSGYDTILNMLMGFGKRFYCDHSRFIMTYLSYRYASFSNTPEGHYALKRYMGVNTPPVLKRGTFKMRSKRNQDFVSANDDAFFDHYVDMTGGVTTVHAGRGRQLHGATPNTKKRGRDVSDDIPDVSHEDPHLDIFYEPFATWHVCEKETDRLEKKLTELLYDRSMESPEGHRRVDPLREDDETTVRRKIFYYDPLRVPRCDRSHSRIVVLPHMLLMAFDRAILPVLSAPSGIPPQLIKPLRFLDEDGNSEDDEFSEFEIEAIAKSGARKMWLTKTGASESPSADGRHRSYASLVLHASDSNIHAMNQMEGVTIKRTFSVKSGFTQEEFNAIEKRDAEEAKKTKKLTWNTTTRRMVKIDRDHYRERDRTITTNSEPVVMSDDGFNDGRNPSEWIAIIRYPMGKMERETFGIYDIEEKAPGAGATSPKKSEEKATIWAALSPEQWHVSLSTIAKWNSDEYKNRFFHSRATKKAKHNADDGGHDTVVEPSSATTPIILD